MKRCYVEAGAFRRTRAQAIFDLRPKSFTATQAQAWRCNREHQRHHCTLHGEGTFKELIRNAVRTLVAEFAVDLETAPDWINSAAGMTALAMGDDPKR